MRLTPAISVILIWGCTLGPEKPDDQDVWTYAAPSAVDLTDSLLLVLNENIQDNVYDNVNSLIIVKENQLVFENYYDQSFRSNPKNVGNISMTVLITALDLLIRDGYLSNLQQKIVTLLPEYQSIFDEEPEKEDITIEHLLTNRSGLGWIQSNSFPDNLNDLLQMKLRNDWTEYVLSKPLEAAPGLRYVTNTGSGMILSKIMENALGSDLLEYLRQELFHKIDIQDVIWETDPSGTYDGGSGLYLKTLDLTKFGYLFINSGRWKTERVISTEWIFNITSPKYQLDNTLFSGYGWWQFTDGILELEENDLYFSYGGIGQQLYVIPHLQMVVSIQAENTGQAFFNSSTFIFLIVLSSLEANGN